MSQWFFARVVRSSPKRNSTEAGRRTAVRRMREGRAPKYARSQSAPTTVAVAPGSTMATPAGSASAARTRAPATVVHTSTRGPSGESAGCNPTAEAIRAEPGATDSGPGVSEEAGLPAAPVPALRAGQWKRTWPSLWQCQHTIGPVRPAADPWVWAAAKRA